MKRKLLHLSVICLLQVLSLSVFAQKESTTSQKNPMDVLTKNFIISNPDTGFVVTPEGNGFTKNKIQASIKSMPFPGTYKEMKKQFTAFKPTKTTLLVDTIKHTINNKEAFTLITEEVSPDKKKYENFFSVTTLVDFGDVTVMVIGAYPKSYDKTLRAKFIKSSLSVKAE